MEEEESRLFGVDAGCGEGEEAGLAVSWESWSGIGRDPMEASKAGLGWLLA